MIELGYETISGTPGTAASLTVAAIPAPIAYPRLSDVAGAAMPVFYTIESSAKQVLCTGVGYSSAAGTFVRQTEFSTWNGTTYTLNPSGLYSLPSGCSIYCAIGAHAVMPTLGPTSNIDANRWFDMSGMGKVTSGSWTISSAHRDHFWRTRNVVAHKVDKIAIHASAVGTIDIGLYAVDWSNGNPGKLLLGWQGVALAAGMSEYLLTSAALGILPKAAQILPIGDAYWMCNWSSTGAFPGRLQDSTASLSGSSGSDLASPLPVLYAPRTNGTSFTDSPTLTGRHGNAYPTVPMISVRGA